MKTIYQKLEDRKTMKTRALVFMPEKPKSFWAVLPAYANIYIRPAYEKIGDIEGLIEFCNHFVGEYSETTNSAKKKCIESLVFPLYASITGTNYDTNLFKSIL